MVQEFVFVLPLFNQEQISINDGLAKDGASGGKWEAAEEELHKDRKHQYTSKTFPTYPAAYIQSEQVLQETASIA